MPLFAPQQIQQYAQQANQQPDSQQNQMPGLPAQQTVQSVAQPNPVQGQSQMQPNKPGLPWGYKAGMVGANLFDGATTRMALGSNKNAMESNPLMSPLSGSTPGFLAAKGGFGLLQSYAMNKLAHEHPKLARGLSLASMAVPAIAGASNLTKR